MFLLIQDHHIHGGMMTTLSIRGHRCFEGVVTDPTELLVITSFVFFFVFFTYQQTEEGVGCVVGYRSGLNEELFGT